MHQPLRRADLGVRRHRRRDDRDSRRRHPPGHRHRRPRRRRGSYRRRHRRDDRHHRAQDDRRGQDAARRDDRRPADGVRRDAGAYCQATCLAGAHPAAAHRDRGGDLEDEESAGRPVVRRRTGCCRRAECAQRAWAPGPAAGQVWHRALRPGWARPVVRAWAAPPAALLLPLPLEGALAPVPRELRVPRAWGRPASRARPLPLRPSPASRCRRP
jgi:hypothetical protein